MNLIAETGHYHFRGRRFINFFWENGVRGDIFYYHEGYDDPTFAVHDPPLHFPPGTGFEWECHWENDSDHESMTCLRQNNEISTIIKHLE